MGSSSSTGVFFITLAPSCGHDGRAVTIDIYGRHPLLRMRGATRKRSRLDLSDQGGVRQGSRGTYLLSQLAEFHTFSRL